MHGPSQVRWSARRRYWIVLVALAAGVGAVFVAYGSTQPARAQIRSSQHPGNVANIYLVKARSRGLTRVTHNPMSQEDHLAYAPSWAPGGRKLVFTQTRCHYCNSEIHITPIPTAPRRWLTPRIGFGFHPRWSPDGRRIAFVGMRGGIYTMDVDGSRVRLLVTGGLASDEPSWSPDARKIAFARQESATKWHIYVTKSNGTGLKRLTRGTGQAVNPAWSPNGRRIAFVLRQPSGVWQIYSMSVDGSDRRRLGDGRSSDSAPTWSPDGRRLAFVRQHLSSTAVYVMNADGSGVRRLTPDSLNAVQPAWSPRGEQIAFAARLR